MLIFFSELLEGNGDGNVLFVPNEYSDTENDYTNEIGEDNLNGVAGNSYTGPGIIIPLIPVIPLIPLIPLIPIIPVIPIIPLIM